MDFFFFPAALFTMDLIVFRWQPAENFTRDEERLGDREREH